MKNGLFKKWLTAALCVLTLGSTAALAEPDSFGLGTRRNGSPTISTAGNIINSYAAVTAPLAPGDTTIVVGTCLGATACFTAGDLVMVLQTTGVVPVPGSGSAGPIDITNDVVGRWEFARLASVSGSTFTLTAPLVHSYAANVTQVIRVPEYDNLTLTSAGRIVATPWNGSAGGVIAFLATGTVSNAGQINANAAGFRGGLYVDDETSALGCTGLDEAAALGAQKGEGIANVRYGPTNTGRGNVANGAGGGVCHKSGGGGGGNYGPGGMGGRSDGSIDGARTVGGMGGSALIYSLLNRITPGGGGGAGQGTDTTGVSGGRGGGAIFIRANQLTGTGTIQASGGGGGSTDSDGGSGGGAGGSVYLRFASTAACGSVSANGGVGGTVNSGRVGPGGGGGGGRAFFQAATGGTCPINLSGAAPGNQQDTSAPDGLTYGATAGTNGVPVTLTTGFVVPPVPVVTAPANGSSTSNRRPLIEGTAQPNTTVVIYIDGVEVGRATSNPAGTYIFPLPADLSEGSHTVQAATELNGVQSPKSAANTFTVDLTKPNTFIDSGPATPTNATSATFDFSASEPGVRYECSLNGATFTTCTDPVTFTGLTERVHTLEVRAIDAAGNVDDTPASYTWTVDLTPPDTVIVSGPPSITNATSATFDFNVVVAEPGVTYECSLDGAPFTSCTDPVTFTGLTTEKSYTLQVRARDSVGNVDLSPASHTWTVDLTPPDTTIVSGPPARTNATSATFDFSSEAGATFECSLDGAPFTSCTDPVTFTGLDERTHTLEVRAKDAAGNVDLTPASYTWTVDLTAPDTVIVSGPPSLTNSPSATFDFSSEAGATFMCRLDAALTFTPCSDPETFTALGDGEHRLEVSAVDAAGNMDPTPAVYTWTVDLTPPDTVIDSGPPARTNATSATFDFSSETGATFECSLDGAPFTACADPETFAGLTTEKSYTLEVRAKDAAGNVDPTPASYTWTVDLTPPDTTIVSGPPSVTNATSATFDFSSEAGATFECSLDGAPFTACSDPVTFTGLDERTHTLEVRAKDAAGNVDLTPASYTWTVDLTVPDTVIVSGPPSLTNSPSATFDFSSEAGATFMCRLDAALTFTPCSDPETFTALGDGEHRLEVSAVDAAGNMDPTPAVYTWTVDLTPPDTVIVSGPPNPSNSPDATFDFSSEAGATFECSLDGAPFTACADPETFTGLTEKSYTLEVRAKDAAGNVDPTPASYTWTVDLTAPETTLVSNPPNPSNSPDATFDFSSEAGATFECSLDGAPFTPCTGPVNYSGLGDGSHTFEVRATDAAGNVDPTPASYTWTVDAAVPDTTIVSGPPARTNATSATFDFSSSEAGVTYECSLDGAAFTACADPETFTGLDERTHTLQVRARDASGNVDPTPATYTWTVDLTPPAVPVVVSPAPNSIVDTLTPVISGTAEPHSTVTIIIDGTEVGTATTDASGNWSYTPTTPLTPGEHEVQVRATDEAGNSSPTSSTPSPFTIVDDTSAPETTITSGPFGTTPERTATFEFSSNEPGVTYECSLDGAAYTPCTSPVTFTDLADGEHTLQVRARDAAGNVDATPATWTWTVAQGGDVAFLGDGIGCSATGGDASWLLMGLGTFLTLSRRRRRS
ncbi:adventurous gliding motility protein AgmC [Archangium violaceum]|uniref:adventurous gliding motility protein AgmC n=1 Tax=Archangium violaceum TaxID=83451 RepID=UPI0036DE90A7